MKADREYKKQQTRIIQSVEKRKAKVAVPRIADRNSSTTAQLFKVPNGLHDIIDDVTKVQNDIKTTGSTEISLYGSEKWAHETRLVALRKLDEWGLVKELYAQSTLNLNAYNTLVGFGTDNVKEPDGLIISNVSGNYVYAGENKLITGEFSQLNYNIEKALAQLCYENRAVFYSGSHLVARIAIHPLSQAALHLSQMRSNIKKRMNTIWYNKMLFAYETGCDHNHITWNSLPTLHLIISLDGRTIYYVYMYYTENGIESVQSVIFS